MLSISTSSTGLWIDERYENKYCSTFLGFFFKVKTAQIKKPIQIHLWIIFFKRFYWVSLGFIVFSWVSLFFMVFWWVTFFWISLGFMVLWGHWIFITLTSCQSPCIIHTSCTLLTGCFIECHWVLLDSVEFN